MPAIYYIKSVKSGKSTEKISAKKALPSIQNLCYGRLVSKQKETIYQLNPEPNPLKKSLT